jgi:hypothetical protein
MKPWLKATAIAVSVWLFIGFVVWAGVHHTRIFLSVIYGGLFLMFIVFIRQCLPE